MEKRARRLFDFCQRPSISIRRENLLSVLILAARPVTADKSQAAASSRKQTQAGTRVVGGEHNPKCRGFIHIKGAGTKTHGSKPRLSGGRDPTGCSLDAQTTQHPVYPVRDTPRARCKTRNYGVSLPCLLGFAPNSDYWAVDKNEQPERRGEPEQNVGETSARDFFSLDTTPDTIRYNLFWFLEVHQKFSHLTFAAR